MIDLHCHILPGVDDGAKSIEVSLEMARLAVADGITIVACTPHILPGVYSNTGSTIRSAVARLSQSLEHAGIPLRVVTGADVHIAPDLAAQLGDGRALTLNNSRYFLLEPPHHTLPPRLGDHIFQLQTTGYVPIITHPERLSWIGDQYDFIKRVVYSGNLMQLTAGSLMGRFGRRPRYWAERMVEEGLCHLLATDAHDTQQRAPRMSDAREIIARKLGDEEATNIVLTRPLAILNNVSADKLPAPLTAAPGVAPATSLWGNLSGRLRRAMGNRGN